MKSIVVSGQKIKNFCPDCNAFGPATYEYGDFPFDSGVVAHDVMRATCDACGAIVAVAHQSSPLLREALERARISTTMRLPRELLDFIRLQLTRLEARTTAYDLFIRGLLLACRGQIDQIALKLTNLEDPVLLRPNDKIINVSYSDKLQPVVDELLSKSKLDSTSDVLRRLIVLSEGPSFNKVVTRETERLVAAG